MRQRFGASAGSGDAWDASAGSGGAWDASVGSWDGWGDNWTWQGGWQWEASAWLGVDQVDAPVNVWALLGPVDTAPPAPLPDSKTGDVTPPPAGDDFHDDFGSATSDPSDVGDATPVPTGVGDSDTEMTDLERAAARHATAAAAAQPVVQPMQLEFSEPLVSSASPARQLPPANAYLQESSPQDGPWTLDQVEKMLHERTSGSKPLPVVETMSEQQPDRTRDDDSTRAAIAVAGSGNGIQPLPPHMWLEPKITNPHRGP